MTLALKAYIESWLGKEEHDLLSARRFLEIEPVILDNACFHCQQAIGKFLKAFLVFQGRDIGRTHRTQRPKHGISIQHCTIKDFKQFPGNWKWTKTNQLI